jgi:predicted RNase H-like HicB family nuclease
MEMANKMTVYVGILDGSGDVWGVRIPDLPGCLSGGATPEEAIKSAVSAAMEWAENMQAHGQKIPPPSPLAKILKSGEMETGESTVMIPFLMEEGRTVRANLSMDARTLAAIDDAAKARGVTRSAFIVTATREKIMSEAT